MKNFEVKRKLLPFLASGIVLLTGCGTIDEYNTATQDNEVSISQDTEPVEPTYEEAISSSAVYEERDGVISSSAVYEERDGVISSSAVSEERDGVISSSAVSEERTRQTTTTTTTTTVEQPQTTTSTKTIKHPGESGYNEFNNHLTDIMGEYNTYTYVDKEEEYKVSAGEDLKTIANKLKTTMGDLIEINHLTSDQLTEGQVLKYRVKDEYLNMKAGNTISEIATVEGIDEEELLKLNDIPEYNANTQIARDASIRLHRFVGNEDSYETHTHKVNVIYNHRISGDKLVFATGFAGASQRLFVLDNSRFIGDTNIVTEYLFDGGENIISQKIVMVNAKDIAIVEGLPVAYLRNENDLQTIANNAGVELDEIGRMQWESTNAENYTVNMDELGNKFIAYSNYIFDNITNVEEEYKVLEK